MQQLDPSILSGSNEHLKLFDMLAGMCVSVAPSSTDLFIFMQQHHATKRRLCCCESGLQRTHRLFSLSSALGAPTRASSTNLDTSNASNTSTTPITSITCHPPPPSNSFHASSRSPFPFPSTPTTPATLARTATATARVPFSHAFPPLEAAGRCYEAVEGGSHGEDLRL